MHLEHVRTHDHSVLVRTWFGMHGTTYEEWPRLCSVCVARQSSQTQNKSLHRRRVSIMFLVFIPLSVALICESCYCFQLFFWFSSAFVSSLKQYTNFLPTEYLNNCKKWAAKSDRKWSLKMYLRCSLVAAVICHLSQPLTDKQSGYIWCSDSRSERGHSDNICVYVCVDMPLYVYFHHCLLHNKEAAQLLHIQQYYSVVNPQHHHHPHLSTMLISRSQKRQWYQWALAIWLCKDAIDHLSQCKYDTLFNL